MNRQLDEEDVTCVYLSISICNLYLYTTGRQPALEKKEGCHWQRHERTWKTPCSVRGVSLGRTSRAWRRTSLIFTVYVNERLYFKLYCLCHMWSLARFELLHSILFFPKLLWILISFCLCLVCLWRWVDLILTVKLWKIAFSKDNHKIIPSLI